MYVRTNETRILANVFSRIIREWAGDDLAEIVQLNSEEDDTRICHTHDFFDANEAMMEAFAELGISDDLNDDVTAQLWGRAWRLAMDNGFLALATVFGA